MKRLLIRPDAVELKNLQALINQSTHQTLVLWALDCAKALLCLYETELPDDDRPSVAIEKGYLWAQGKVKMPEAKKAILDAHRSATEHEDNLYICALARAIGQGISTIHVRTHAMGIVIYGITAFMRHSPNRDSESIIKDKVEWFYHTLLEWQARVKEYHTWAPFLLNK